MSDKLKKAIVLLSGGLDSSTVLAMANRQGYQCYALSFDYGQRSLAELNAARAVAGQQGVIDHKIVRLSLEDIGGSALTDRSIDVPESIEEGVPVTYVPARNTVFLSLALGWAEVVEAQAIFIGVNAVDYSGYPDCRPAFIEAFQALANVATKIGVDGGCIKIETPLMTLTKAEIIQQGINHGLDYSLTVSCYQADDEGNACGVCDSCRLRSQGFADAGVEDVTRYVSQKQG
ncbi:7-cyano-7-deazaguanine synthase QueC [Motiliproteus sp. MSK22-1]|uniref:7-cyano-7-deazaguanine synthase QueC n=1 Tax=Motiliproteus sp. MSK22-1 TaxID=1897630 RepID=UPI00097687A3|nr:7-cyano-7-deazaguanine synthase QueC [Motiliproteus sp. MSK22-1]OMH38771.1 7-cyano-7-deazaguanine synthase QueC [Motiliproteus sp. MSK22-1]